MPCRILESSQPEMDRNPTISCGIDQPRKRAHPRKHPTKQVEVGGGSHETFLGFGLGTDLTRLSGDPKKVLIPCLTRSFAESMHLTYKVRFSGACESYISLSAYSGLRGLLTVAVWFRLLFPNILWMTHKKTPPMPIAHPASLAKGCWDNTLNFGCKVECPC